MLWWLAETTVIAGVLAGAAALLCRLLRPRPAVRHALWLVVLLKLLTPPLVSWPWAPPEPAVGVSPPAPPAELPADEAVTVWLSTGPVIGGPFSESEPDPAPRAEPAAPRPEAVRLAPLAIGVWGAGAAVMALVQLARVVRFRRQAARGGAAPAELTAAVAELAARLGVRPPPVVVVPSLASPVVWGLGPARLLWPAALLGRLSPDGERTAIAHELAHLRRRDHWVGWLQLAASCAWWWSPLFWAVRRQLGRAAESACDACVIETFPKARRAYAEVLLAVCELVSRPAAPVPALGMGGARQEIERRLTMILRESVPSRAPLFALFGVVLLALIALPGFSGGQDAARTADPTAKPAAPAADLPAARAAVDEREQRLQKLEATLDALLKEVKDLRAGSAGKAEKPATTGPSPKPTTGSSPYTPMHNPSTGTIEYHGTPRVPAEQPTSLQRVTYNLPGERGKELASLLKDVKAPVLETVVFPDSIVVTTTPEAQRVIGEFVALLQGKLPASKHSGNWGYPAPQAK
jgi:beta-lactamase regulating signal transducer with metallopeptidase domain